MIFNCNKRFLSIFLIFGFLLMLSLKAFAQERDWLQTYPYWTADKGELDFEQWHNANDSVADNPEEWFELEYGVTSRYMTSLYMIRDSATFKYKAWKTENIYRMANPGELFVDPAIYLEYQNNSGTGQPDGLEAKIILQKYFRKLYMATNFAWEKKIAKNGVGATPLRFDRIHVAAAYPLSPHDVDAGLEFSRYVGDNVTSLMPGIYANFTHHGRILIGWEIPVQGVASSRIRTGFEWEF